VEVPFVDLGAQHGPLSAELVQAVTSVFENQQFILGPQVAALETELASFLGVSHVVGVASGSDALFLVLKALGLGPGCGAITTPFSFVATATAIVRTGARPLFVDVDPTTFNLDPAALRSFCEGCEKDGRGWLWHRPSGSRVVAVVPVHLFGRVSHMEEIARVAREYGLELVEDAAQAIGARAFVDGEVRAAGSIGVAGAFSFYPSKNLGGAGDGGAVVTNRAPLAGAVRKLANHGSDGEYYHTLLGYNSRLDSLQAAVLRVKLRYLEEWNRKRRDLARLYRTLIFEEGLDRAVVAPAFGEHQSHVFHQYVIRLAERDRVREYLRGRGIEARVYYPVPLHLQPCLAYLGHRPGDLPEAERLSREVLSLPFYPEMKEEQVRCVVRVLAAAVRCRR